MTAIAFTGVTPASLGDLLKGYGLIATPRSSIGRVGNELTLCNRCCGRWRRASRSHRRGCH